MRQRAALFSSRSAGRSRWRGQRGCLGLSRGYHFMVDGGKWKWIGLPQFLVLITFSATFHDTGLPRAGLVQGSEEAEIAINDLVEQFFRSNGEKDSLTTTPGGFLKEASSEDVAGTPECPFTEDTVVKLDPPQRAPGETAAPLGSPHTIGFSIYPSSQFRSPFAYLEAFPHEQEETQGRESPVAAPLSSSLAWREEELEVGPLTSKRTAVIARAPWEVPPRSSEKEAGVTALFPLPQFRAEPEASDRDGLGAFRQGSADSVPATVLSGSVLVDFEDSATGVASGGVSAEFCRPCAPHDTGASPHADVLTCLLSPPALTHREDGRRTAERSVRAVSHGGIVPDSAAAAATVFRSAPSAEGSLVEGLRAILRRSPQHEDGGGRGRLCRHTRVQPHTDGESEEGLGLQDTQEDVLPLASVFPHPNNSGAQAASLPRWQAPASVWAPSLHGGWGLSSHEELPSPERSPVPLATEGAFTPLLFLWSSQPSLSRRRTPHTGAAGAARPSMGSTHAVSSAAEWRPSTLHSDASQSSARGPFSAPRPPASSATGTSSPSDFPSPRRKERKILATRLPPRLQKLRESYDLTRVQDRGSVLVMPTPPRTPANSSTSSPFASLELIREPDPPVGMRSAWETASSREFRETARSTGGKPGAVCSSNLPSYGEALQSSASSRRGSGRLEMLSSSDEDWLTSTSRTSPVGRSTRRRSRRANRRSQPPRFQRKMQPSLYDNESESCDPTSRAGDSISTPQDDPGPLAQAHTSDAPTAGTPDTTQAPSYMHPGYMGPSSGGLLDSAGHSCTRQLEALLQSHPEEQILFLSILFIFCAGVLHTVAQQPERAGLVSSVGRALQQQGRPALVARPAQPDFPESPPCCSQSASSMRHEQPCFFESTSPQSRAQPDFSESPPCCSQSASSMRQEQPCSFESTSPQNPDTPREMYQWPCGSCGFRSPSDADCSMERQQQMQQNQQQQRKKPPEQEQQQRTQTKQQPVEQQLKLQEQQQQELEDQKQLQQQELGEQQQELGEQQQQQLTHRDHQGQQNQPTQQDQRQQRTGNGKLPQREQQRQQLEEKQPQQLAVQPKPKPKQQPKRKQQLQQAAPPASQGGGTTRPFYADCVKAEGQQHGKEGTRLSASPTCRSEWKAVKGLGETEGRLASRVSQPRALHSSRATKSSPVGVSTAAGPQWGKRAQVDNVCGDAPPRSRRPRGDEIGTGGELVHPSGGPANSRSRKDRLTTASGDDADASSSQGSAGEQKSSGSKLTLLQAEELRGPLPRDDTYDTGGTACTRAFTRADIKPVQSDEACFDEAVLFVKLSAPRAKPRREGTRQRQSFDPWTNRHHGPKSRRPKPEHSDSESASSSDTEARGAPARARLTPLPRGPRRVRRFPRSSHGTDLVWKLLFRAFVLLIFVGALYSIRRWFLRRRPPW